MRPKDNSYQNGWIQGFEMARSGKGNMKVTHLKYVYDTLIFCKTKEDQLRYLRVILVVFEGVYSLHVNWKRSLLFSINEVLELQQLSAILGAEFGALPTIYLG